MGCGLHCNQNVSNVNFCLHGLAHPFFNLMQCEKIMGVATTSLQSKIAMSSSFISSNMSSSLDIEVKQLLLEKEAWLSLEENIFGLKWKFFLGKPLHYITLMRILKNYMDECHILLTWNLSPLHCGWFFLHHPTYT